MRNIIRTVLIVAFVVLAYQFADKKAHEEGILGGLLAVVVCIVFGLLWYGVFTSSENGKK